MTFSVTLEVPMSLRKLSRLRMRSGRPDHHIGSYMGQMGYIRTMTVMERRTAEIGRGIAEARRRAGLSQQELAEQAGTTRKDVSRIENGHPGVAWSKVAGILEVLGHPLPRVKPWSPPSLEEIGQALDERRRGR